MATLAALPIPSPPRFVKVDARPSMALSLLAWTIFWSFPRLVDRLYCGFYATGPEDVEAVLALVCFRLFIKA